MWLSVLWEITNYIAPKVACLTCTAASVYYLFKFECTGRLKLFKDSLTESYYTDLNNNIVFDR